MRISISVNRARLERTRWQTRLTRSSWIVWQNTILRAYHRLYAPTFSVSTTTDLRYRRVNTPRSLRNYAANLNCCERRPHTLGHETLRTPRNPRHRFLTACRAKYAEAGPRRGVDSCPRNVLELSRPVDCQRAIHARPQTAAHSTFGRSW